MIILLNRHNHKSFICFEFDLLNTRFNSISHGAREFMREIGFEIKGKHYEVQKKVYAQITQMIIKNELRFGDQFKSATLSEYISHNHFYLTQKSMKPEHFKVINQNGNPLIVMYIPELPSSDKYRILHIWPKLDFFVYKELYYQAIMGYLKELENSYHHKMKQCEQCKANISFGASQLIYTLDDPEEFVQALQSSSNLVEIKNVLNFNFAQSDIPSLRKGTRAMEEMERFFMKSDKKIICNRCEASFRAERKWKLLESETLSMKKAKIILKKIIKTNQTEDIKRILEILEETKKIKFDRCSRETVNIITNLHYVISDLLIHRDYGKEFAALIDVWVDRITKEKPSLKDHPLLVSIILSIFRSEISDHIAEILNYVLMCPEKVYSIFRELASFPIIDEFIELLIEFSRSDQIEDQSIFNGLSGFIYAPNQQYLQRILENFDRFPQHVQKHLITELSIKGNQDLMERLEGLILKNNTNGTISESIIEYFSESYKEFKEKNEVEQRLLEIEQKKHAEEEKKMNNLYDLFKKKKSNPNTKIRVLTNDLLAKYRSIIKEHIETYESEFMIYFSEHRDSLVSFDIEEIYNQSFLVMALEIKPDLTFFIKIITVDSIYPIKKYMDSIPARIRQWLASVKAKKVMTHGTNEEEAAIIEQTGHEQVNTQDVLEKAISTNAFYGGQITNVGLKHFEEFIRFKRKSCSFFKHDISIFLFTKQTFIFYDRLLNGKEIEKCEICKKPEDIMIYCLEDAFSSILIYVYFKNHEPEMMKELGY